MRRFLITLLAVFALPTEINAEDYPHHLDMKNKDTIQVTKGDKKNVQSADWSPDGDYIVVSQGTRNLKLHMYHKEGGGGVKLIKKPEALKIVEPETRIFTPASLAILQFSKLIPPSISISTFNFF